MHSNALNSVPPRDAHVVTAREALEPLYERYELEAEAKLVAAALDSGWTAEEAALAVAKLRLEDAITTIRELE